jgi:hypothetical protein
LQRPHIVHTNDSFLGVLVIKTLWDYDSVDLKLMGPEVFGCVDHVRIAVSGFQRGAPQQGCSALMSSMDLVEGTRAVGKWWVLWHADDVAGALAVLPKLPQRARAMAVAALLRESPRESCRALSFREDLQKIPVRDVVRALSPYAKREVASSTRTAAAGYLHEAVFTRADRHPCTHNALVSFLVLQDSATELNACVLFWPSQN